MRITAVDPDGARGEATSEAFTVIVLAQAVVAAPNPASDSVTFYYDIATNGTLYVYDIVDAWYTQQSSQPQCMRTNGTSIQAASRLPTESTSTS